MANSPLERGKQYTAYLEAELKREEERRESVNSRAVSAVTGSTGLATLVLAVFAVLIGKDAIVHGFAKGSLAVAVVLLLGASGCAVMAARTRNTDLLSIDNLRILVDKDHWLNDDEATARYHSCKYMLQEIGDMRGGTTRRGKWLRTSAILQALAVAALAFGVIFVAYTQDARGGDQAKPRSTPTAAVEIHCQSPLWFLLIC